MGTGTNENIYARRFEYRISMVPDRRNTLALFLVMLLVLTGAAAGCTSAQKASDSTLAATAAATSTGVIATQPMAKTANVDTQIAVNFNDYACLDVQKEMGTEYLYPDEKYTLSATTPGTGAVNVNLLFLDANDNLKFREVEPVWDSLNKKWEYPGLVPLAQFNDITGPVQKTFIIKTQSKYYICVDDRKETGLSEAIYHVPVKLLKVS